MRFNTGKATRLNSAQSLAIFLVSKETIVLLQQTSETCSWEPTRSLIKAD